MKYKRGETDGAYLKRLRLALEYSQEKLAPLLGVSARTLQRYESGRTAKVPSDVIRRAQRLAWLKLPDVE